ncbi:thioesterase [Virgibacillus profundi]|uniref:Thioesterase n=1 Tax=Virgibacillus profundi TaxID=2024555 RepID=A0A2A2ICQ4_9BACI|nr:PaaI family thioesterase [Virgibacillus profundi]PAV28910.1 thioesterase [Virgibacillus profundi]PXY53078.1 PaaI family thioesterase [Virgibacillus profundi]
MANFKMSDFQKVADRKIKPPPCDDTMQITVHESFDGIAYGTWKVDRKYINGIGVAMGGFLSSAADIMMAYAISSKLTDQYGFASINLDTTFHRPVVEGEVDITARVERLGRTLAYVVSELKQNNKIAATCISSILIKKLEE